MKDVFKLAALFFSMSVLFSTHATAEGQANLDEIIKTCEAESEGMADPEAYIQQCIEDMSGQTQKSE